MRVPEEILQCVVYIALQQHADAVSERRFIGTGFFVGIGSKGDSRSTYCYLVTAKHCVAKPLQLGELFVRLNTHDGGCEFVKLESSGWLFSDNPATDIAVLPFAPDNSRYQYKMLDETMLGTEEKLHLHQIGIGDEVIMAGLFTRRAGRQKNLPIVRFGNISAMPDEALPDDGTGLQFRAYLIEARSIGGLSGSPVFAYLGPDRVTPDYKLNLTQRILFILGVVRGHWEHEEPPSAITVFRDELDKVNWGIAVVTPCAELASVLYGEELVKRREKRDDEIRIAGLTHPPNS